MCCTALMTMCECVYVLIHCYILLHPPHKERPESEANTRTFCSLSVLSISLSCACVSPPPPSSLPSSSPDTAHTSGCHGNDTLSEEPRPELSFCSSTKSSTRLLALSGVGGVGGGGYISHSAHCICIGVFPILAIGRNSAQILVILASWLLII